MSSKLILLLVAVFTPTALSVTCTYTFIGTNYVCSLINQVVNSENDFAVIDGNHILDLGNENVTGIISSHSTIRVFPSLLIDAFVNLNSVTLTNSMMTSFVSSITNCQHLDDITVEGSDLTNIPQRIFERCASVRSLSLKNSKLATMHSEAFYGLNSLQYVWLDHNNLTNLGNDLFLYCKNLVGISLIGNQVATLQTEVITNLPELNELELGHNRIQSLPNFTGAVKLVRLDASNNEITEIKAANFEDLTRLILLTLSHNLIDKIENGSFTSMTNLRHLSLANNKLRVLEPETFTGLVRLDMLDLSNNQLAYFNTDSFSGQPVVSRFKFNDNQIRGIERDLLEKFTELQRLDMLRNECADSVVTIYRYDGSVFGSPSLSVCFNSGVGNRINLVLVFVALSFSFFKWF